MNDGLTMLWHIDILEQRALDGIVDFYCDLDKIRAKYAHYGETATSSGTKAGGVVTDLHSRLSAAVRERRQQAEAATKGPWRHDPGKRWLPPGVPAGTYPGEEFVGAGPLKAPLCVAATGRESDMQAMLDAAFIAANDPATVLRRCERDEKVLERHRPVVRGFRDGTVEICAYEWAHGDGYRVEYAECPEVAGVMIEFGITEATP
ncbi:MAG TPA: DUF6221 family protein [Gemmatimonadales bacterium]